MATFTALVKILSLENHYNTKIAGLGEILSHKNFRLYDTCTCLYTYVNYQ